MQNLNMWMTIEKMATQNMSVTDFERLVRKSFPEEQQFLDDFSLLLKKVSQTEQLMSAKDFLLLARVMLMQPENTTNEQNACSTMLDKFQSVSGSERTENRNAKEVSWPFSNSKNKPASDEPSSLSTPESRFASLEKRLLGVMLAYEEYRRDLDATSRLLDAFIKHDGSRSYTQKWEYIIEDHVSAMRAYQLELKASKERRESEMREAAQAELLLTQRKEAEKEAAALQRKAMEVQEEAIRMTVQAQVAKQRAEELHEQERFWPKVSPEQAKPVKRRFEELQQQFPHSLSKLLLNDSSESPDEHCMEPSTKISSAGETRSKGSFWLIKEPQYGEPQIKSEQFHYASWQKPQCCECSHSGVHAIKNGRNEIGVDHRITICTGMCNK